jgi:hypothetical protein
MANGLGDGVIPGPFVHSQVAHPTYMLSQPSLQPSGSALQTPAAAALVDEAALRMSKGDAMARPLRILVILIGLGALLLAPRAAAQETLAVEIAPTARLLQGGKAVAVQVTVTCPTGAEVRPVPGDRRVAAGARTAAGGGRLQGRP